MRVVLCSALVAVSCLVGTASEASDAETSGWRLEGFDQPESVIYDANRDQLIVSNINGAPGEANGEGYLSAVTRDGEVSTLKWVTGLDAPKGMGISGDRLYVTDLQRFHVIDLTDGSIARTIEVPEASFLNDVSIDADGNVYVSDLMDHAIYRFDGEEMTQWLRAPELSHPNGILALDGTLYVGSWGEGMRPDFTTEKPGKLLAVDIATKGIGVVPGGESIGNIDGIVAFEGSFILSDWVTGKLHKVTPSGEHEILATVDTGVADIGSHDGWIYLPFMMNGAVEARPIAAVGELAGG